MGKTTNEVSRIREARDHPDRRAVAPACQTHAGPARRGKLNADDKQALRAEWAERARGLGFDAKAIVDQARARANDGRETPLGTPERVQTALGELRETAKVYTRPADELTTNGLRRVTLTPTQLRTEMATASAVRVIGERETSWTRGELVKTALDLGLKGVTAAWFCQCSFMRSCGY